MRILSEIDWRRITTELNSSLSDRYRRIWIHYTRFGSVQITLFPRDVTQTYTFVTLRNFIDINRNLLNYARMLSPDVILDDINTEHRLIASNLIVEDLVRRLTEAINENVG